MWTKIPYELQLKTLIFKLINYEKVLSIFFEQLENFSILAQIFHTDGVLHADDK